MSAEIVTFGCRLNAYESEVIRAHTRHAEDLVVVNTCAVTQEAERQARQAIRRAHRSRPGVPIVVTGCAAQIAPQRWAALPGVSRVLGNLDKLAAANWQDRQPSVVSDISRARQTAPHLVADFPGRSRAFLEVQQGCDHRCTFCIIPYGRGPSRSVAASVVIERARALVAAGFAEIVLTGVDVTSYGSDLPGRPTLGQLAGRLLRHVPELGRLRLSSLDPVEIDDDLWRLWAEDSRLLPHIHLSVQAGSDLILKRMKRRHQRADALRVIARLRHLRGDVAVGADIIAGFPTETEDEFRRTLDFVDEAAIAYPHVFPYSERPGTPAARMPAVPVPVRRERAARLRAAGAAQAARFHAGLVGRVARVLVERDGKGRSEHFAPVSVPGAPGAVVSALLAGASAEGLRGVPLP